MSANDHTTAHEEAHTGPIKTPQQLLAAVFFSFVVPVFGIIALVFYVVSANKPGAGADLENSVAQRIERVGHVEIRDANRPLKSGEEVFKAQCAACHATGALGSPKFGDVAAWAPRIKTGFEALWNSALKGKGAMPPQGGGDFDDTEIGKAVVYMTTAAGGTFPDLQKPAAAASAPAGAASAAPAASAASGPPADVVAALAAANKTAAPAAATPAAAGGAAPALYAQVCFACHAAGVAGAPKLGDKAAWGPRIGAGVDALTASAIHGKGAMPPKGGSSASDADIKAVVQYMVNAAK